jgi:hypothetical protein
MSTELYLDTARFGRTRRRAWHAQRDFLRLCAEEAGSAHIEALLRQGNVRHPGTGDEAMDEKERGNGQPC